MRRREGSYEDVEPGIAGSVGSLTGDICRLRFAHDERAASTVLGYVLALTVTATLISGLFIAGADLVEGQRDQVVRGELRVIGQDLAAQLAGADRLARTTDAGVVEVSQTVPRRVGGVEYTVSVAGVGPDRYELRLETTSPDVLVTVGVESRTPIDTTSRVHGGPIVVDYRDTDADPEKDELVMVDG